MKHFQRLQLAIVFVFGFYVTAQASVKKVIQFEKTKTNKFVAARSNHSIGISNTKILQLTSAELETVTHKGLEFTKLNVANVETNRVVGAPELPVKSYLLVGRPEDIKVQVNVLNTMTEKNVRPWPTQPQDCRCETKNVKAFTQNMNAYNQPGKSYELSYMGAFRGTPVTRLDVALAQYEATTNSVVFHTAVEVNSNAKDFSFTGGNFKDYLILAPMGFSDAFSAFTQWKESRGYTVRVREITADQNTKEQIAAVIKDEYTNSGIDFVIIVGDENVIPMYRVKTDGSSQTPSDLPYFTFDGGNDFIPDVFYSRLAVNNPVSAMTQLKNSMDFESRSGDLSGFQHMVGIASNEGANPSDDEYVQSIESRFNQVLGINALHLHQDNSDSNPTVLNSALGQGAFWLTYMGHGSGYSWPSMNRAYSLADVKNIKNRDVVRSIIIDVACQNGRLTSGHLGTAFMQVRPDNLPEAFGAVAYFGGSVNISWHPPAVMAQGITFEHLSKNFKHLGEALLAGQLYLAGKWNAQEQVRDNFEWYHLQGDPGLDIHY